MQGCRSENSAEQGSRCGGLNLVSVVKIVANSQQ